MSHDENNFSTDYANYFAGYLDYIDPTGTLGFNIEQDAYATSTSAGVSSSDYIIEVHYLGSPASTIKLDVENISSNVNQVDFIVKSVAADYAQSPENVWYFKDGLDSTEGLTNWSGDMSGVDPAYGLVEIDLMDGTSLAIESSLYHEVIQVESGLIDGLSALGSGSSSDVNGYANMLSDGGGLMGLYSPIINDASNDIETMGIFKLDQNPEMVHLDPDVYMAYEYNAGGSSESLSNISEASLVAEFRITPQGLDWSFDTNFEFSLTTDTTVYDQYSLTYVSGVDSFDTGVLADIGTSISHDSMDGIKFAPIGGSADTGSGPDMTSVSIYYQYDLQPYTDIPDNGGYTAIWNDNGTAMAIDVEYDTFLASHIVPDGGTPYEVPFNGGTLASIESLSSMYTIDLSNMGSGSGGGEITPPGDGGTPPGDNGGSDPSAPGDDAVDLSSVSVYSQVNLSPFTDISSATGFTAIWINADDVAMAIDVVPGAESNVYNVPADGSPYPVPFNGGDISQIEATTAFGRANSGTINLSNMGGGEITPPVDGGGEITPPGDGGTPPVDGGGEITPPIDMSSIDFYNHNYLLMHMNGVTNGGMAAAIWEEDGEILALDVTPGSNGWSNAIVPNGAQPYPITFKAGSDMANLEASVAAGNRYGSIDLSNMGGGEITPPVDGGGEITPPGDGGTPPVDGGGEITPPVDGGGTQQAELPYFNLNQNEANDYAAPIRDYLSTEGQSGGNFAIATKADGTGEAIPLEGSDADGHTPIADAAPIQLTAAMVTAITTNLTQIGTISGTQGDGGGGGNQNPVSYISYGVYDLSVSEIDMLTGQGHGNLAGDYFIGKSPDGQILLQSASYDTNIVEGNPWVFADGSAPISVTMYDDTTIHEKITEFTSAHSHSDGGDGENGAGDNDTGAVTQDYWKNGHEDVDWNGNGSIDPGEEGVDGSEVIQYVADHVAAIGGTSYVDAESFVNDGVNSINTADVTDATILDAGTGDDFIVGGVGGYTVNGGDGFDNYLAAPASLENIFDADGNIIDQNGVIVDLSASRVTYLDANTNDIVENIEYFMGTTGDDIFVGASRYESQYQIQAFNGSGGSDEIFGAETTTNPLTNEVIDILTAADYSSMQGGQGAVFILDGSNVMSSADTDGNLSYSVVQNAAGDNWNNWLPYNEGTLNGNNISTVSTYDTDKDGASVILDTFGDVDIAFNVDHYIGSGEADVFFGSNENDTFDAAEGTGNFMSGGDGIDELIVNDLNEGEDDDLDLSSIEVGRSYSHQNHTDVDVSGGKFVSDNDNEYSGGNLYRIDFAEVNDLHSFIGGHVSPEVSGGYSPTSEYALFIRTNLDPSGMTSASVMFDSANQKIDVTGTDISILDGLDGQLVLAEQAIVAGQYVIEGRDASGNSYSTIIEDVEKVTLTTDDIEYFGTNQLTGSQEDTYELILGGQGDLGNMLYVTTGETLISTTGVSEYIAGPGFITGEVYYSGNHSDFDRNSNTNGWANSVASAYTTIDGQDLANIWNDEIAQFFVWYDADGEGGNEGYEIAVKYQNGGINAWGIDNRQFDTFQTVQVDQTLADAIKLQFGDSLRVETGSYRVLYEAAFSDIETIVGSSGNVQDWNFNFNPSSSRSTFYIQVGGDATGENGSSGVTDTNVTNVKVEYVAGEWVVNPQAEILVNLPEVAGATENADVMISGDAAETIEAGRGSDVMMGRGGSDNYKINVGDTLETDDDGNVVAGDYGVAGDVINEIGGSSEDKSDSITLSSAQNIDQLTFTRTEIKNEEWSNTLKIDVDYEMDGTVDDTLFVFDHYNQNLGFRSVEQLFLDDGWDSNEIWNLVVGDVNEGGVDEYAGSTGQDILMAGAVSASLYGSDGQDIMIGDNYGLKTTFELGNREGAWDQVVDIIQGFGASDELDLSNLGIESVSELTYVDNDLFDAADGVKIAEFSNFNDGLTLEQLLTEDGAITYSGAA